MYYDLPKEITEEQLDKWVRDRANALRRESYTRHPERVMRQRLRSAVSLLARQGLIDDQTRDAILARVGGAA